MSKFEIRSPMLITAALALAPALAFAADTKHSPTTTTTTTTTATPGSNPSTLPPNGSAPAADPSGVLSPSTPPDMQQTDTMRMNANGSLAPDAIDPAQVQKVFGMDVALIDLKTLNKEQVKLLQQRLQERGFYRGKVDGAMGPQTRNALTGLMAQQYALNQRLANQGQITEQFASSIGIDMHGRAAVTGVDRNDQATQHPAPRANPQPTAPVPPNQ
jgi:peptidoglycan hydrolase-like protein with peptidoglycan-binding domain